MSKHSKLFDLYQKQRKQENTYEAILAGFCLLGIIGLVIAFAGLFS